MKKSPRQSIVAGPYKEQFTLPLNRLRASRSVHAHRRLRPVPCESKLPPTPTIRYPTTSSRPTPRSQKRTSISCSIEHLDQAQHWFRAESRGWTEISRCPRLPAGHELVNEHHEVRIAHRDGDTGVRTQSSTSTVRLAADLGLAHGGTKLKCVSVATRQFAGLQSRISADHHRFAAVLRAVPGRDATRAVARDLRIRAVGIDQPDGKIGIRRRA